ncbi:hypothetical protein CBER1_01006 [Cercospora berteroae]|uniref:Xylanolytic transcriptional activator regulatory domain-containing protein n=1 Tax=Cercospora berteroae TaxID=357750 RepID=A0A2S6C0Y0_9PEZI|nr:hypothetical protein CBER1_01006 [Cercospora berteroae]
MPPGQFDAIGLMPLETPILKVSRPVAACSRCRNAKIKCDGTNDQFARGKERSYVSTLETRIEKLKEKLEDARARKPSVVDMFEDDSAARRQSYQVQEPPTPNTPNQTKAMRRKEAATIDDLVSDFGFLSVNATARDFYGFTSAMSYARLVLWASSKEQLPKSMSQELPPRHQAVSLIQHYLNNVFVLLPVFDEASFWGSVDRVYSRHQHSADGHDHYMVRIVLAIASASMSEQRGDQRYMEAIGHICAALSHSEDVFHPGEIASIQALILLTEFAMLDPHHFDSWELIGAASRAMVDLGLHQDPPKGTAMPKAKLDLRRRVYHCVYALDRSTSLVQTRAFSFSDDSARVKIPFSKPTSSAPTSPAPNTSQGLWLQSYEHVADLIKLRQIQSQWYTDLFQSGRTRWEEPYHYIWDTCDSMRKWFDNLSSSMSPNTRAFFELDLLYSYVYVLSPSPRVPVVHSFAQKLIFEYCIRYADLMLRIICDPGYTSPLTFYDAMRVYMTGRQFLDVLQHNIEGLLPGHVPAHPEVKPSTAAPPRMPVAALPSGDTVMRFNITRSISCIKQITECLSKFGIRWGYMSWNQRYQTETSGMLDELNSRLREIDGTARRQSTWHHHGSTGSIGSSINGSLSYAGSPSALPAGQSLYQGSPAAMQHTPGSMHAHPVHQVSPPAQQVPQQVSMYQTTPPLVHGQNIQVGQQGQQQQQQSYFQKPVYNFNEVPMPPQHQRSVSHQTNVHPASQFANWTGYGGPGGNPDTLDEENAIAVEATRSGAATQLNPGSQIDPHPVSAINSDVINPVHEAAGRADRSRLLDFSIPKTSILPELDGRGPAPAPAPPGRRHPRSTMMDAATTISSLPVRLPYAQSPGTLGGGLDRGERGM